MVRGYNYFLGASRVDFASSTKEKRLTNNGWMSSIHTSQNSLDSVGAPFHLY
jgi:hypothetical protein